MKKIILIIFCSTLLFSCSEGSESVNLHSYATDKTWKDLGNRGKEYHLSSVDEKRYMWIHTGSGRNEAKGTPITNPLGTGPGWYEMGYFKIQNDTLFTQSRDDVMGENIHKTRIEIGKDTTIGIVEYQTLRFYIYSDYYRTWISKK